VLGRLAVGRGRILEGRGLEHWVVHDAAVGGSVGSGRTNTSRAVAPNLLQLCRGNISTVVGSDRGPELVAASLVNGAEAVSIDNLGLMSDLGVNAQAVEGLGRSLRGEGARLGQENLVLGTSRGSSDGSGPNMRATVVAHRGAVTGRLRVRVVVDSHGIGRRGTVGAARGGGRNRRGALAAVATVGKLVEV